MDTISLWESISTRTEEYPELTHDIEVDVVIVGAGITGLTAALKLSDAGKKVAILEAGSVGNGTTGFSTGNLYIAIQSYYQKVLAKFDEETVKKVAESRKFAIDYIEDVIQKYNIDCNFKRRPWYLYTDKSDKIPFLERELNLLKKVGQDIEYATELPLPLKIKKAIVMKDQARLNPLQYTISLTAELKKRGCAIFENSRVIKFEETDHCIFYTDKGKVKAKKGILATHTPIGINSVQMFTAPYRSYVVAVHLKDNDYPEGNFWNVEEPHYATSTHSAKGTTPDLLAIAGSHHKTGQASNADAHYQELKKYLNKNYSVEKVIYRWSAQHYHSADTLPYIGLKRGNKFIYQATGFFADGLVFGTVAGILMGDEILGKNSAWKRTYNSSRNDILASLGFLVKENINIFAQYMKDFPKISEQKPRDLKPGEGKVIDIEGEKCGVYCDLQNKIHKVSAVCPHMKCIVSWNNAERTWDCPCHGSRFSHDGKYIEGPAMSDLPSKE